ncbi:MAG: hypothetical protein JWR85_4241 [Marmoricola sp.]|nr:hypothetical protein [Marmoricola sp.]
MAQNGLNAKLDFSTHGPVIRAVLDKHADKFNEDELHELRNSIVTAINSMPESHEVFENEFVGCKTKIERAIIGLNKEIEQAERIGVKLEIEQVEANHGSIRRMNWGSHAVLTCLGRFKLDKFWKEF